MQTNIWTIKYKLRPVAHCSSGCWLNIKKSLQIMPMKEIILLSFINASISFTVSESKIFQPLRDWCNKKSIFIGSILTCGYCLGFWVAFALVAIYRPKLFELLWLLDYFLTALVIAWLSAFQWVIMCWLIEKTGKWFEIRLWNSQ